LLIGAWLADPVWEPEGLSEYSASWQFAVWSAQQSFPEPSSSPESAVLLAGWRDPLPAGVSRFKKKIAVETAATEVDRARRLLERMPGGAMLRLDANGGLDRNSFEAWSHLITDPRIEFLEQPFPPGAEEYDSLATSAIAGKLALDESVRTYRDWLGLCDSRWQGWGILKPSVAGWPHPAVLADPRIVVTAAFESSAGWRAVAYLAEQYSRNIPGLDTARRVQPITGPAPPDGWTLDLRNDD